MINDNDTVKAYDMRRLSLLTLILLLASMMTTSIHKLIMISASLFIFTLLILNDPNKALIVCNKLVRP